MRTGQQEYAFDLKMFATVRVKANGEEEARALLREHMDCITCTTPGWPDGTPNTFEASLDDAEGGYLIEVDGREVDQRSRS